MTKTISANGEAYQAYLKGLFYMNRETPEDIHQAVSYLQQAASLDRSYALADAALAEAYLELGLFFEAPRDVMPVAKNYAKRALDVDPSLVDAHIALGVISLAYDWDREAAAEAMTINGMLVPQAVEMFTCATHLLDSTGRPAAATSEIERSLAIDPLSAPIKAEFGCSAYYQRRYVDSERGFRAALVLDEKSDVAYWGLAKALDQQGRHKDAIDELMAFSARRSGEMPPIILSELACAYVGAGRSADARRTLERLTSLPKTVFVDPYLIATVYLAMGDTSHMFEALEKSYDLRSSFIISLASEPKWDGVRADPRFQDLVKRVGYL